MPTDKSEWLAKRMSYVTASDVSALLGESPYKTREQLRMEKMGLADDWTGNEHTDLALAFESRTIEVANERFGWAARPNGLNIVVDPICGRLAATPDAYMDTPWGTSVVQVKWTCAAAQEDTNPTTKKGRPSTAAYVAGPPLRHQLQVQTELACTGLYHGVLLVLHHGQGLKLRAYYIPRHEGAIARIRRETIEFWDEIDAAKQGLSNG